jgi:DNA-binding transcriptional MocR family regulator
MLIMNSMGQNPTSGVLSLQRRRDLYALCSQHDIIIIEDDPYWYLQFPTSTARNTTTTSDSTNTSFNPDIPIFANAEPRPTEWKSSGYPFLDSLVPSYVSVDTDGRVIRLDTFSKTVAPGCRLGWITAQPALVEKIMRITETSSQQPSGFVQSIVAELVLGPDHKGLSPKRLPVVEGWKGDGWVRWLEGLRGNYERRMNTLCRILDDGQFLVKSGRRNSLPSDSDDEWSVIEKTQLYSFDWPVGGMFIWWKINFASHKLFQEGYRKEPERFSRAFWIWLTTKPYRVLVAPGIMFSPTEDIKARDGWRFFRICFAAIDEGELKGTGERLVQGVEDFWRIRDRGVVEGLLEEDGDVVVGEMADMRRMVGPC